VFALVLLYFLHSLTFLLLSKRNAELYRQIAINMPRSLQTFAALLSVLSMGAVIVVMVVQDVHTLTTQSFGERLAKHSLTSLELAVLWSTFALVLYFVTRAFGRGRSK